MALTHVLICNLDEIVDTNDLRSFFQRLISNPANPPVAVDRLSIEVEHKIPPPAPDLTDTARSLVTRASGPVVRIGTNGFEDLVIALWSRLWPVLRRRFSFRLSFGPGDIVEQPGPTLVCTPASLIGRWQQHRIVGRSGTERSLAAAMIDGSDVGIPLRQFAEHIAARLAKFEELPLLEQAYLLTSAKPDSVARLLAAVRLIERLSPLPIDGEKEKRAIIERLVAVLPEAAPSQVLSLRNVLIPGFATGGLIWREIQEWLGRSRYLASDDADMREILHDALIADDAQPAWRGAVTHGLKEAAHQGDGAFQAGFWRWAATDTTVSSPLITLLHDAERSVKKLVEAAPADLNQAAARPILASSAKLKLFQLHAVAASASLHPLEAVKAQSAVEPGNDPKAMRLALRKAKPMELLNYVSEVSDERVLRIAGETVAKKPSLLANRDMSSPANRRIWAAALEVNPESWRGPTDPRLSFEQILIEQIEGHSHPGKLLELLSATPLADLSLFARRRELWTHVHGDVQKRLLDATTDKWFEHAGEDSFDPSVEPEMERRILQDSRLDQLLNKLSAGRIVAGLRVIAALPKLGHGRTRDWIMTAVRSTPSLSLRDADLVGQSIAARGRRDVVDGLLFIYRSGRDDIKPALRHCLEFIGIWERLWLGIAPVTDTEKWESFIQLAAELYPSGPDYNSLWERAGGRDSDLIHHGSGTTRWRDALSQLQKGKPPQVGQLVREMRNDFGGNSKLRLLADDPLFRR